MMHDVLNLQTLSRAMGEDSIPLFVYDCIDSTNEQAKRMAIEGERRTVLIAAAEQTAGRGRMGRSFYSPSQTGIYFSILHTVDRPLQGVVSLTGAAAVAVMRAIRQTTGRETEIKWVNDLYLDGKKVCGILAEALSGLESGKQHVILGIGINLSTEVFPEGLAHKAGAVHGREVTRAEVIAAVWRELQPFLKNPDDRTWLSDYRTHSCVIGKKITWQSGDGTFGGTATGINHDGELEVRADNGEHCVLRTGEISVRIDP